MTNHRIDECREALAACGVALDDAEGPLTEALAGAALLEVVELAEEVEGLARALHRLQLRAAGAVEAESPARRASPVPFEAPFRRGCDLLRSRLRISGAEARRRIRAAESLLPRFSLTGSSLEPLAPMLALSVGVGGGAAEKAGTGDVPGAEAVAIVLAVLDQASHIASPDVLAEVEATMTGYAATFDPETLRRVGTRILSHLDPDGEEPTPGQERDRQGVKVGATWKGMTHLDIWADAVQAEVLLTVFDAGSNPRPIRLAATTTTALAPPVATGAAAAVVEENAAAGADAGEGIAPADDRTRPQRMLDALVAACQAALRARALPDVGGQPPQLLVTMTIADLVGSDDRARTGAATLTHMGPVPVTRLRRLACDADVIPIVLGTDSEILDLGRANRLVPARLRRALIARDGGCIFPGCAVPATWTEGHHVREWADGGATSTANMTLLCPFHHHAVHEGRWRITASPGNRAVPAGAAEPVMESDGLGLSGRPFVVTSPWASAPEHNWNAYPRGA